MVMASLAKMESEGKVQEIVDKKVGETVEKVIEDAFGSWSDFSKGLKEEVQKELQINFEKLNLSTYNHMIMQSVKGAIDDAITKNGVDAIKNQIEGLLLDAKQTYDLSELVKELAEEVDGLDELGYEETYEMTLHIEEEYSFTTIHLDPKSDVSEYDCKYRLLLNKSQELISVQIDSKERYSRSKNISEFDVKAVMQGLYGLEKTLFKMYASGAKLIVDEDKCETELSNPDYE